MNPVRFVLLVSAATVAAAQAPPASSWTVEPAPNPQIVASPAASVTTASPLRLVFHDQRMILTSPGRITGRDTKWLIPLTGALTFLLATDRKNMQDRIQPGASLRESSALASDAGVGALASIPLLLYWHAWREGDDYARTDR